MVAIPKLKKSEEDPKSYRPIFLLCVPYKILERLIHTSVEPIIDPQLPREQTGFQHGDQPWTKPFAHAKYRGLF